MVKANPRIDQKDLTRGQIIALTTEHPDALHLYPSSYIAIKGNSIDYTIYQTSSPYGSNPISNPYVNVDGTTVDNNVTIDQLFDIPNMSDIESVTFEPYYDTVLKKQRVRALIKIKNSSDNATNVEGVDTRIFNPNTTIQKISTTSTTDSTKFTAPSPGIPNVIFKRDGTSIAWGWDNVSGLNSYYKVEYEWIISTSSSSSAPTLNSGTIDYSTSGNNEIGTNGTFKQYRVSSRDGNTPATSAARWLRVRTKVVGTDNNTYYSSYSTPI